MFISVDSSAELALSSHLAPGISVYKLLNSLARCQRHRPSTPANNAPIATRSQITHSTLLTDALIYSKFPEKISDKIYWTNKLVIPGFIQISESKRWFVQSIKSSFMLMIYEIIFPVDWPYCSNIIFLCRSINKSLRKNHRSKIRAQNNISRSRFPFNAFIRISQTITTPFYLRTCPLKAVKGNAIVSQTSGP